MNSFTSKDLKIALENKEFFLLYQPKVSLVTGEIIGSEALIRWAHPSKGLIPPAEFITLAESTHLIKDIGKWVITEACQQTKAWQEQGYTHFSISVNLSVVQLYDEHLIHDIKEILAFTKLQPGSLQLELTESMMIDIQKALPILNEIKGLGVNIHIDDFGTGYSSLAYLRKFPIDQIKIDKSFINECTTDHNDEAIVKAIISMAHALKIGVVAEGVETREQLIFLQQFKCDEIQGYYISAPLPSNQFIEKVKKASTILNTYGLPVNDQIHNGSSYIELEETIRLQQGMILKFKKYQGRFIHTLCDGELLRKMGLTSRDVVGKDLKEFLPLEIAEEKYHYYEDAWNGIDINYEGNVNGIHYFASLHPIKRGGKVVEVIGSCVEMTKRL